jgi:hypothetical protein
LSALDTDPTTGQEARYTDSSELRQESEVHELNTNVLEGFSVELSLEKALERLKLDERRSRTIGAENVFATAATLIHPQAIYGAAYVSNHSLNKIEIEGMEFTSRVLTRNLESIERVFPYVLTIGESLENAAHSSESITARLILETVGDLALASSLEHVKRHISRHHGLETVSDMGPGQLDWPIEQQRVLFSLLGPVKDIIGVTLTESLMMVPRKSISGMIFPAEDTFLSCQLCKRNKCPSRKAQFDEALSNRYGYDQPTGGIGP